MKTHKLMIKTHNKTGLKYLCYTRSEGTTYDNYKGSGKLWKHHLKKYGDDISTELIYETPDFQEFKSFAIQKSIEFDIVNSELWANLKLEEGDGGDTVSNKMWITDGNNDKYILKDSVIPVGWIRGRSKCIFNDSEKQKEFSKKASTESKVDGMKAAWASGKMEKRDNSKCGVRGENNPAKSPEVRQKIKDSWKNRDTNKYSIAAKIRAKNTLRCEYCNNEFSEIGYYRWHGEKCKLNVKNKN